MLQAIGLTGGGFILIVAFRAIFVMGREEYFAAQRDYEDGFQKRKSDAEEYDLEAGNGEGGGEEDEEEQEGEEEDEETISQNAQDLNSHSYIDYNSTSHPQEPLPSIPSTTTPTSHMVQVPPPGNSFPPPPPRNTRSNTQSSTNVPIAQPISESSHEDSYVPYTCGPEVKLVHQNSDLSKFVVVHEPAAAPPVL